jgi:DNA replication and repair protein RecF
MSGDAVVISRLVLRDFRNYTEQDVSFCPGMNVVCGENAQGKTNLLDAVCTLADGRSPWAGGIAETVRFGAEAARVSADVSTPEASFRLVIDIPAQGRRRLSSGVWPPGGHEPAPVLVTSARGWLGKLPVVLFSPEELQLVKGPSSLRRRFLDAALCRVRPAYWQALARYNKLREQKAKLLRDGLYETLPDYNRGMADHGAVLIEHRADYVSRLMPLAAGVHGKISGGRESLTLSYVTDCDPCHLYETLTSRLHEEKAARQCLTGPHRDDFEVMLSVGDDGNRPDELQSVRQYGSQGQARTAALSLKLAERALCREFLGTTPVLLLDDVLSELDAARRDFVLHHIGEGQVLLTCCEGEERLRAGRVLRVENGVLTCTST